MRIAICGGPRVGKSTLALELARGLGIHVVSTDEFIGVPWGDVPDAVMHALAAEQSWIVEGVNAGRVIRRWLTVAPSELCLTRAYWLEHAVVARTAGQTAMAKGCRTVFDSLRPQLAAAGVPVIDWLQKT